MNADRLVEQLSERLLEKSWQLALAESCTGGMLAAACTARAGSSQWFERGWVTYSNAAKQQMLSVPERALVQYGAVSREVAEAMAQGAIQHSAAQISLSVTGVAGPAGGTANKPVGLVCFAVAQAQKGVISVQENFAGDRQQVREQAVNYALNLLLQQLHN